MADPRVQPKLVAGLDSLKGSIEMEVSDLPEEWQIVKVKDVAKVITGKTPSTKERGYWEGSIPFITPVDLQGTSTGITDRSITEEGLKVSKSLPSGTVMVSCIGYIGKVGVTEAPVSVTNQQINSVLPDKNVASSWYLAYAFMYLGPRLKDQAAMTTVPILNKSNFEAFEVPLPPLSEQKAIAHVLRTVQKAIESTEQVIQASRELKRSLMNHLFTYGPVPVDEAEQVPLKETEIGLVPEHWDIGTLGSAGEILMGQSPKGDSYNTDGVGVPLVNGPAEFGDQHPRIFKWTSTPTKTCREDDVLICVRGNTTGRMNIADGQYCIGRGVAAVRGGESESLTSYLYFFLEKKQRTILEWATAGGSTFPNITKSELGDLSIPLPSLAEQEHITHALSAVDQKSIVEQKRKQTLQILFNTLLQNLMTGKVRVNDLDLSAMEEMV